MVEWEEQKGSTFWKPEVKGDFIEGTVAQAVLDKDFGMQYTIKTKSGETIITPSHTWLQNRMRAAVVGMQVRIVYDGTQASEKKGHQDMKVYKVFFAKGI